jgi:outer membrane protein assembly factor BamB/DNA-directed RNA polymerase subunit RPC12/RpoP
LKAIQVTCPNCGARLRVGETSTVVRCEYCGTDSTVQRRTAILERVMTPPVTTYKPVAVQRHSRAWIVSLLFGLLLPLAIGGFALYTATSTVREAQRRIPAPAPVPAAPVRQSLKWQGTASVLIADVNGDGKPELIGRGREVLKGDIVRLIALDVATGALKWQSEPLGTYSETYRGLLGIEGGTLIYTTQSGEIRTFAMADGSPRWRVQLDERVKELCGGNPAEFVLVTADDMIRSISRVDGTTRRTEKLKKKRRSFSSACDRSMQTDGRTPFEEAKARHDFPRDLGRRLDLDVDVVTFHTAFGARTKGTRVTTIVGLTPNFEERWRTTASPDPLGSEGAPRYAAVGNDAACIVYYGHEYRMACFALDDGKRLWDDVAPSFFEALIPVDDALVMTTHRQLEVRDIHTGKIRWALE